MESSRLAFLNKYVYLIALLFGIIGLVASQFADTGHARILYTVISLGPLIIGVITPLRSKKASGEEKQIARAVVECAWVCLSFGLSYLMMLVSTYYAVPAGIATILVLDALLLAAVGLYTLIAIGRMGFSLTP